MNDYEVGIHFSRKGFDCIECARQYYNELSGLKYLAECRLGMPVKIISNTYGWQNK